MSLSSLTTTSGGSSSARDDGAKKLGGLLLWDIFISYAWGDGPKFPRKPLGAAVAAFLRASGYSCWLDVDHMAGTNPDVEEAMALGIARSSAVVVILSDEYAGSENCKKEARFARDAKKPLFFVNGGAPKYMPKGFDHADEEAIRKHIWLKGIVGEALWADCREAAAAAAGGGAGATPEVMSAALQTPLKMLLSRLAAVDQVHLPSAKSMSPARVVEVMNMRGGGDARVAAAGAQALDALIMGGAIVGGAAGLPGAGTRAAMQEALGAGAAHALVRALKSHTTAAPVVGAAAAALQSLAAEEPGRTGVLAAGAAPLIAAALRTPH